MKITKEDIQNSLSSKLKETLANMYTSAKDDMFDVQENYIAESTGPAKKAPVANATKYVRDEEGKTLWEKAINFWDEEMWVTVVSQTTWDGEAKGKPRYLVGSSSGGTKGLYKKVID